MPKEAAVSARNAYFCGMTDTLTAQAVELLRQLIATPRVSRSEAAAADLLEARLRQAGLQPNRVANNVWLTSSAWAEGRPTMLLCAHIDTVRPAAGWTRDPHSPDIEGDVLYGLGANDDGASLVSLLQVFRTLHDSPALPYNLVFLASAEEEVSGRDGVELALRHLPHIDVGLVGEPTGMQPAVAEKGLMVLDCVARGKAGHAARDEGVNAIYLALDDMAWLRTYAYQRVSPLLGAVRQTVTIVNAGTQHNVVPAECTFTVDVRSNELYTNAELLDIISHHLHSTVTPRSTRLSSSAIDMSHPLVERAVELGRTPFGSPTLSDQALMPFPTLKMGPGDSRRSHTADEYVRLSEIREAISLYHRLLAGLTL